MRMVMTVQALCVSRHRARMLADPAPNRARRLPVYSPSLSHGIEPGCSAPH